MTRKKPSAAPSAAQARARSKKQEPAIEEPVISVGDRVRIRPTAEHPVSKRGLVTKIDGPVISVNVGGYVVRYREAQLVRVVVS